MHIIPEDEEKFLVQLSNEVFYLMKSSIPKQKILIEISILWGKFISETKNQSKEDMISIFTINIFKKYLDDIENMK